MATVRIDVGELASRLSGLPAWTQPGDEILVTQHGSPVYRLVPTDCRPTHPQPTTTTPAPQGAPYNPLAPHTSQVAPATRTTPRPLGTHLGHTTLSPDFNDPSDWDGTPLPKESQ